LKTASLKRFALAGLLTVTATGNTRAWDGTGHMLIAQIARDRLTDRARARVDALAARLQRNGVPYNGVNIACWADDIRTTNDAVAFHGQFKPWHFINIGCSSTDPDVLGHLPVLTPTRGNLVVALAHCVDLIRRHQTDALVPDEAVALALVMHLAGDIHQPLHCATRYYPPATRPGRFKDDGGGEDVPVANLAQTARPNLHTFWDEAYRRYSESGEVKAEPPINEADPPNSPVLESWLARLQPDAPLNPDLHFNPTQWAMETHALGCAQAYGTLDEPDGSGNVTLRAAYVTEATRTARRQIVLAGYRLAALLNELYGQ
jgi:hypothetical protein